MNSVATPAVPLLPDDKNLRGSSQFSRPDNATRNLCYLKPLGSMLQVFSSVTVLWPPLEFSISPVNCLRR